MEPERWQQIKEVLQVALEQPPSEREASIARACGDDESLRQEVMSLLKAHDEPASVLEMSAFEVAAGILASGADESLSGQRIGAYEIIRELGRGGMGAVYLGIRADDQYHKTVAVKLIKRGMDTEFILRRFRHERQILANLEHANIARLLDGGTTGDGQPYLVMEYVEGIPVTDFCDQRKLSVRERLELFRTICSAVHYAHQNLVVHRDLKPSNILVSSNGVPKLLDFGIAKLLSPELTEETIEATGTAQRLMTPDYASPEQVRGEPITTATDVYSLGVILYELLTGRRPHQLRGRSAQEVERVITNDEPPPPLLSGDLDNIILKALRKEPLRRYASADQLSEDLRRYLEGRPVTARKDTFGYRAGKFIRRNRAPVAVAALLLLSLIGGIAATLWQARAAMAQRTRAERRFSDVRKLANSFLFEFHDAIQTLEGATPARELLVKRASAYLDSLAQEAVGDRDLQRELATAYEKVGDIQGDPYSPSLGNSKSALASHQKAQSIRESLLREDPNNRELQRELASSYLKLGDIRWVSADWNGAAEIYRKALSINEALVSAQADDKLRSDLVINHQALGDTLLQRDDLAGALDHQRKALALREQMAAGSNDAMARRGLAVAYAKVADVLVRRGEMNECLEKLTIATQILDQLVAENPTNAHFRSHLHGIHQRHAQALLEMGRPAPALEILNKALVMAREQHLADPANAHARRNLAGTHQQICTAQRDLGMFRQAVQSCRESLQAVTALAAADPGNAQAQRDIANVQYDLSDALAGIGDLAGAEQSSRKGLSIAETLAAANPDHSLERNFVQQGYGKLGRVLVRRGLVADGLAFQQKALGLLEALIREFPENSEYRASLARTAAELGETQTRLGHWREARELFRRSLAMYDGLRVRSRATEEITRQIAECNRMLGGRQ